MKKHIHNLIPNPMKNVFLLCLMAIGFFQNEAQAQCSPDTEPPVAICDILTVVHLDSDNMATLSADIFDDGSHDNCTDDDELEFFVEEEPIPSSTPPSTDAVTFDITDIGPHIMIMWVVDSTGNWNYCAIDVEVFGNADTCNDDVTAPTSICHAGLTVSLEASGDVTVWGTDFNNGSFDDCTQASNLEFRLEATDTPSSSPPSTESLVFDAEGTYDVVMWVGDAAGNWSFCQTTLEVEECVSITNLTCNNNVEVYITAGETEEFYPADILEGGPYCFDEFSIQTIAPTTTPVGPFIEFDETFSGIYTVQVISDVTGNSCWGNVEVLDCGANSAPTAVCDTDVHATVNLGETITRYAVGFDDGSWDACTPQDELLFTMENGLPPSSSAPSTTQITFDENDEGLNNIVLWVGDTDGNWSTCVVELTISVLDCDNDIGLPTPFCVNGLAVELPSGATEIEIWAADINDASFDDCTDAADLEFYLESGSTPSSSPPSDTSLIFEEDTFDVVMWVVDEAGNADNCQTTITVSPCVGSTILICNDFIQVSLAPGPGIDFTPDMILEGGPYCESGGNYFAMQFNPPSTLMPVIPLTAADIGEHTVSVGLYDEDDNLISACWGTVQVEAWSAIVGHVFADTLADCTRLNEPGLESLKVQAIGLVTGATYETTTTVDGAYDLQISVEDTLVEVSLSLPFNYGLGCQTTYTIAFVPDTSTVQLQDIPVRLDPKCPLMSVDISAPLLRRCFDNTYYVNYCNLHNIPIENVSVEVALDEWMDITSSSIPGTDLGDGLWNFDIGTLEPGECGSFVIDFYLDCETPWGLTHCVEAHIQPDTICPQSSGFSGANIEVSGYCENDLIYLSITNTGTAAMAIPLDYIVVEDVIMFDGGPFDLNAGQTMDLDPFEATGSTYRLEAMQETNHPYGGIAAIAIEGCGDTFTPGFVNFFPMNDPDPFFATDCQPNIGAYDPNDKTAFPAGYGDQHYIEKNTDIEYRIRFQNTGTDTAFNVVLLDTLSQYIDPASIRPGAASHDFQYELLDNNVVRFTFANIMLPDSNVNEALSHGFVKFKISQMPDLELETVIENTAAIYFDFNEAVLTNTVFHTIGEHFIEVISDTGERSDGLGALHVFPNPSFGNVTFELPADAHENAVFQLHDPLGRLVRTASFTGGKYRFERAALAPGVYFYTVDIQGVGVYSGKIILK